MFDCTDLKRKIDETNKRLTEKYDPENKKACDELQDKTLQDLIKKAVSLFGGVNRTLKAIEEFSELNVALSHFVNKKLNSDSSFDESIESIHEELADAEILLNQLWEYYATPKIRNQILNIKTAKFKSFVK